MSRRQPEFVPLRAFKSEDSQPAVSVEASILIVKNRIEIDFKVEDVQNLIKMPSAFSNSSSLERKNDLWQTTCFEAFLGHPGSTQYLEINLSPWGAWNAYRFQNYRTPSPPVAEDQIQIESFSWSDNQLHAVAVFQSSANTLSSSWDCSLTAVIETLDSKKIYFATKHAGAKPDFHLRESFNLKRNSKGSQ